MFDLTYSILSTHCKKSYGGFRCDVKFRQIEENSKKLQHLELSNSVISLILEQRQKRYVSHKM